jgi:hypothetical protein
MDLKGELYWFALGKTYDKSDGTVALINQNLIIANFIFLLKLRLDVQAPPISQSNNPSSRLF